MVFLASCLLSKPSPRSRAGQESLVCLVVVHDVGGGELALVCRGGGCRSTLQCRTWGSLCSRGLKQLTPRGHPPHAPSPAGTWREDALRPLSRRHSSLPLLEPQGDGVSLMSRLRGGARTSLWGVCPPPPLCRQRGGQASAPTPPLCAARGGAPRVSPLRHLRPHRRGLGGRALPPLLIGKPAGPTWTSFRQFLQVPGSRGTPTFLGDSPETTRDQSGG